MKKRVWSMLLTLMAVAALLTVGASATNSCQPDQHDFGTVADDAVSATCIKCLSPAVVLHPDSRTDWQTEINSHMAVDKTVIILLTGGTYKTSGQISVLGNATIIGDGAVTIVQQSKNHIVHVGTNTSPTKETKAALVNLKLTGVVETDGTIKAKHGIYAKYNTVLDLYDIQVENTNWSNLLLDNCNFYVGEVIVNDVVTTVNARYGVVFQDKVQMNAAPCSNPDSRYQSVVTYSAFNYDPNLNTIPGAEAQGVALPASNLKVNGTVINPAPVELTNGGTTTGYFSLQKAIDAAAAGNNTITLKKDISDDVIVTQKEGINIVIDGADKKYSGTINIYGDSRHDKDETLTIQNINFTTNEEGHNFIWSDKADNANREKRYAHNVTVQDCSFTATDGAADVVGLRIRQGYGVDVKRCIATDMHSLMQFSGSRDILVDSVKVTGLSGINLNTAYNVTVQNSEFTVRDHAIRIGAANSASSDSTKSTLKITGNKLTSTGSGDAVIVVRQSSDNVTMTVFKNAISGQKHIEVPEATFSGTISADANYWDGNAAPTVSGTDVEITCYYSDAELTNLVRIGDNGKAYYPVTFNIPEGATIESVSGDVKLIDGAYYLASGPHTVTVTKKGYYEANETFEVNGASMTVTVELALIPNTYRISVAETANGTVTLSRTRASRNSLITITATPDAGYKAAEVEVTNFRGEEVAVTDAGDGTYTFRMPGSTTNVSVTFECDGSSSEICSSSHLSDVDQTQWYHIAVDYAVSNGLMSGIGEGKFAPEATMERSMVIQVLYNMEGQPAVKYNNAFSDVAADKWYANAIQWGVDNGILVGYGTEFDPAGAISREEMVYMMYNYAQYKGKDTSARGDLSKYADGATTSSWAVEYVKWAVGSGVMVGGNTILNPTGTANRAEVAQIFKNFHEIFG